MKKPEIMPLIDWRVASNVAFTIAGTIGVITSSLVLLYLARYESLYGDKQRLKLLTLTLGLGVGTFTIVILFLRVLFSAINRRHINYMELEYAKLGKKDDN